jgi:hypothetical protein
MNITIRNIPDEVIEKIKTFSKIEKRSLNNEILVALERGVREGMKNSFGVKKNISKQTQIKIWQKLADAWQDDRSPLEITEDIYRQRTLGRDVEL